jgi:hypothetical protein
MQKEKVDLILLENQTSELKADEIRIKLKEI